MNTAQKSFLTSDCYAYGQLFINPTMDGKYSASIPFSKKSVNLKSETPYINYLYDPDENLAEIAPDMTIYINDIKSVEDTELKAFSIYGSTQLMITMNNGMKVLLCCSRFMDSLGDDTLYHDNHLAVDKERFIHDITSSQGVFVNSGGIDDWRAPVDWNNTYFDSVELLSSSSSVLCFSNKHSEQVIDGKTLDTIYAAGSMYLDTSAITSIMQIVDDHASDVFDIHIGGNIYEVTFISNGVTQKITIGFME